MPACGQKLEPGLTVFSSFLQTTMNRLTCRLAYLNRDKLKSYPRDIVGQIATAYRNSDPSTMSRRAKTNMRATSADQAQRRPKRKASSPYEKLKRGSPLLSMSVETSSTVRPASDSFFPPIAATAGPCIRRHSTGCISMPPTEPSNVSNLFFGPSMHPTSSVEHEDALARQDALEPPISPLSPHPVNYLTYALLMNGTPVLIPSAQVVWPQLATPQDAQQMLHFQGHPSQLPLAGLVAAADCHRNGTPPVAPWTLDGLQHQGGLDGM